MRRVIRVVGLGVGLALCMLVLPAQAAPSLEGYTGLLLTPTADALSRDEFNAAFFTLNLEEGADTRVFAVNAGVSQDLEVGFARIKPEHSSGETILNGKWQARPEDGRRPALAMGVIDATDELETTAYFVASKSFTKELRFYDKEITNPRLHVGIGGGQLRGLFGGASAVVANKLTLIAEYDTEDVNLGARLAVGSGIRVHAGWLHGLDDFAVGVSYNRTY